MQLIDALKKEFERFSVLDKRKSKGKMYSFPDFFLLLFIASVSGCNTLVKTQDWLSVNREAINATLPIGLSGRGYFTMPRKSQISVILNSLDPNKVNEILVEIFKNIWPKNEAEFINVIHTDGKHIGKTTKNLFSVLDSVRLLCIDRQFYEDGKEVAALQNWLKSNTLKEGTIVTGDAIHLQKKH